MAEIDMPLEALQLYQGTNPRPEDFDLYWEKALADLCATDPDATMSRCSFQPRSANCYDLYFTGVGGARVHAQVLIPKNHDHQCPAVLQFHGYGSCIGDWNGKLNYVSEGFVVAAMDCRGQAGKSDDSILVHGNTFSGHIVRGLCDAPEKLYYRSVYLDTVRLAQIVMGLDCVDKTRVAAMGGSQGGGLSLACAALVPNLNRIGIVFPFLSDFQRAWEMGASASAYKEIQDFFRYTDPQHERETLFFTRLGYIDVHHLASRIKAKVLMGTGLMDSSCPPSTHFAVFNQLQCDKELMVYPDFGHEELPHAGDRIFEFLCGM